MRGKDVVALGRIVVSKRERVVVLQAWEKGILATTLRYAYEVRDTASYFSDITDIDVPTDMLKLAEHILESKAGDFEPAEFKDRYEEGLVGMLRAKQAGIVPREKATDAPPSRNVVNLMEALRKSLGAPSGPKPRDVLKPKKAKTPKRIEGQREMLLPIAGKGPPKAAEKKPRATSNRKAG